MNDVPVWIEALQALATPAIALGGGLIAYRQWRTAHQKVMLDLFDRRLAVYDEVVGGVQLYFERLGDPGNHTDFIGKLYKVRSRALFLFDNDVADFVDGVRGDIIKYADLSKRRDNNKLPLLPTNRADLDKEYKGALSRLINASERMTAVCLPYIKIDAKAVPSLRQAIVDRNRIRLSYADDKQRVK